MYPSVKSVTPLEGHRLLLEFANGEEKIFDVSPYLNIGKFSELRDPSLFRSVMVKFDSIEWANQLDIDPEILYDKSVAPIDQHAAAGLTRRGRSAD
jgi:hypothetical protein